MGFQRPPNSPDWIGSFNDSASEKILPRLIRRPASITSWGVTLFSVPIWSSLPQRPQFDSFFAASSIAALSTFMGVPHSSSYRAAKIQSLDDVVALQFVDRLRRHHDLAVHDDVAAAGDPYRLVEVLLGHQHGQAKVLIEFADLRDGLRDQQRRQADRGLVDQQQ